MTALSIHIHRRPTSAHLAYLRDQLHPDVEVTCGPDLPTPANYHILVAGRPKRDQLIASPNLQTLIIPWAGVFPEIRDLMREFPHIAIHNLHHNAAPAAEMAVTLMLTAAKFILPIDRALRAHDWRPRYQRPNPAILMEGRTALILGYGAIGQRVARACHSLGMEVIATRRHVSTSTDEYAKEIHPPGALLSLLPRADALIICLPLTEETKGLIGEKELKMLPPRSVLVNVGRGEIVEEDALYNALHEGTLYAAGLDVWYNYPTDEESRSHTPPSDYAFHELDNVVMSPHRAGAGGSEETERRRMDHLAVMLNAAARGERIPNRFDLQAGY